MSKQYSARINKLINAHYSPEPVWASTVITFVSLCELAKEANYLVKWFTVSLNYMTDTSFAEIRTATLLTEMIVNEVFKSLAQ